MKPKFALCAMLACLLSAIGCNQAASPVQQTESTAPEAVIKDAVAAYLYLYPLVVFGVSTEALTNVEKPTWETLSAPINQFMSVRESRRLTLLSKSVLQPDDSEATYFDVTGNSTSDSTPVGSINRARQPAEVASRKARMWADSSCKPHIATKKVG